MFDVLVFIASVGPVVAKENLLEAIYTISKNIGECNYKFYIVVDDLDNLVSYEFKSGKVHKQVPITKRFVREIFENKVLSKVVKKNSLLEVVHTRGPWYKDFNYFVEKYKDDTKYFLVTHDDVVLNTDNFYNRAVKEIEGYEDEIGWIVCTNDRSWDISDGPRSDTTTSGFHTDREDRFRFECHNFELGQKLTDDNKHLLDLPKRTVKCHGPLDFNLVSSKALQLIGPAADFGPYTMLLNEDWALESLKNNLINIWIPDIFITHPNKRHKRDTDFDLRFEKHSHDKFHEKWGFYPHEGYTSSVIKILQNEYKETNIPWSSYRKTYEWDYLKDE